MTINEAIDKMGYFTYENELVPDEEDRKAIKLGVEALRRVNKNRQMRPNEDCSPLPGETDD